MNGSRDLQCRCGALRDAVRAEGIESGVRIWDTSESGRLGSPGTHLVLWITQLQQILYGSLPRFLSSSLAVRLPHGLDDSRLERGEHSLQLEQPCMGGFFVCGRVGHCKRALIDTRTEGGGKSPDSAERDQERGRSANLKRRELLPRIT